MPIFAPGEHCLTGVAHAGACGVPLCSCTAGGGGDVQAAGVFHTPAALYRGYVMGRVPSCS